MYVVISIEHNDGLFFLFTCIATPLPVNNRGGKNCVCVYAKDTSNRTTKRKSVHMAIKKKTKVDERESKEIKTKQKREEQR